MVAHYAAASTQQLASVALGACYPIGTVVHIGGAIQVSQDAFGHPKTWTTYILDAPYAGSVAGALATGTTGATDNGSDDTSGAYFLTFNGSAFGLADITLAGTTDHLYLVAVPNYAGVDWYSAGGSGLSVDSITGGSVSCGGSTPPVADFSGTPLTGHPTLSVAFTDHSTNTPTSWSWTFGDSGTSTSQNPSHNYTAAGTYTVALTATNADGSDTLTRVAYVVVTDPPPDPVPGGHVEFDDEFVDISSDIMEWTITRGASPELTGGSTPGSATIELRNLSDQYNPENAGGPNFGFLHDGPRTWIGVNEDGTIAPDAGKDVYGLFAGRITELSLLPVSGASVSPTAEMVCEDPLGWYGRTKATVADSTTRSQYDLRVAVLDVIDPIGLRAIEPEPTTLPLSSADGLGLNILDAINASNGTRHFAKPADNFTDWFAYTTVRRTSRLDGTAEATADAASQHVTSTSGWRTSADGVINQQKASVEPISFPARILVWQPDILPMTVTDPQTIWLEFGDYVRDAEVEVDSTGSALTTVLTPFGRTAKLDLTSAGTTTINRLDVAGYQVERGSVVSVTIDDLTSQSLARGVRAGPDLTGDYLGTISSAKGFAQHIVWRFGDAKYRPTMVVENWFPTQFDLDLYDRISLSIAELSIADRIFEIVGLTHHGMVAALDVHGDSVAYHTVTYTLQESRVQTPTEWFTTDVSTSDGPDHLAY